MGCVNALELQRADTLPPPPISMVPAREATISVAASGPFVKVLEAEGPEATRHRMETLSVLLPRYGLSLEALASQDARIPHSLALDLLSRNAWWLETESIAFS